MDVKLGQTRFQRPLETITDQKRALSPSPKGNLQRFVALKKLQPW
jgi:hypothetical protein